MDLRILLAPDKFKGTLDAPAVARAMALGARAAIPTAAVSMQPLADGGEGSLDCVAAAMRGKFSFVPAEDAFGAPVRARVFDNERAAMIAVHETQRLAARPTPAASLRASSRGAGLALAAARRLLPDRDVVVWVGGTASTDGGAGAAQAAGWRLLDGRGHDLPPGGGSLRRLARIEPPPDPLGGAVTGACDVDNPLTGERGAARVFGPQKGAGPGEVRALEDGLETLARRIEADLGLSVAASPFGGAGGGLGAGLAAFFGASLEGGFDRIAQETGLRSQIAAADVVITGEGRIDGGTLGGKVVANVARLCAEAGTPCLVVAGDVALPAPLLPAESALGATALATLVDHCGRKAAFEAAADCVRTVTAALLARALPLG